MKARGQEGPGAAAADGAAGVAGAGVHARPDDQYRKIPALARSSTPTGRPRDREIVRRYAAGDPIADIARDCGVAQGTIYLAVRAAGIPLRGPARGPRKKAAPAEAPARDELPALGAWETPSAHYALQSLRYEPVVRVQVTYRLPRKPYQPPMPAYQAYRQVWK